MLQNDPNRAFYGFVSSVISLLCAEWTIKPFSHVLFTCQVPRRRKALISNRGSWGSLSLLRQAHLGEGQL